jgi:gliding motility-associated lipoprotein GldH
MRLVIAIALSCLLLSACDDARVYEKNKDFDKRLWLVNDTARFDFEVTEGDELYNIHCNLRNSVDYKWQRIFINFVLSDSAGHTLSSKLVSNYLFEPKTGKPFGRSGLGDLYDHRFPLLSAYALKPGKYSVTLQQLMRADTLQGILAAGIRVERAEQ